MKLDKTQVNYALHQLAQRAGIVGSSSEDGFPAEFPVKVKYEKYAPPQGGADESAIFIQPAESDAWLQLLNAEPNSITWVPLTSLLPPNLNLNLSKNIPVLFPTQSPPEFKIIQIINKKNIVINYDFVCAAFFMLSRYEEIENKKRDKYGRFPAQESVSFKQGFINQPIIDELGIILRAWIQYLFPEWEPNKRNPEVLLTHDIDFIRTLPNLRKVVRKFLVDLKSEGAIASIRKIKNTLLQEKNYLSRSQYLKNISTIIVSSLQNNLSSIFFFKAGRMSFYDSGYDIDSPSLKKIFKQISEAGFEIGLHPGFNTYKNSSRMRDEKEMLERSSNKNVSQCRQHYLRFDPKITWKCQQDAGFSFDHTLAYAQHEGFRCGTCHPFKPYDFEYSKEFDLTEIPLVVMDSTLKDYQKYSLIKAEFQILDLAKKCYAVEGTFTLLWHNTSISGNWSNWGMMYKNLLPKLSGIFNS